MSLMVPGGAQLVLIKREKVVTEREGSRRGGQQQDMEQSCEGQSRAAPGPAQPQLPARPHSTV